MCQSRFNPLYKGPPPYRGTIPIVVGVMQFRRKIQRVAELSVRQWWRQSNPASSMKSALNFSCASRKNVLHRVLVNFFMEIKDGPGAPLGHVPLCKLSGPRNTHPVYIIIM